MTIKKWNVLLLSSFVCLIPAAVNAQTTQSQSQSVCSPNLNESNNNAMTIGGDCSQTIVNNTYNGPVYTSAPERRGNDVQERQFQKQPQIIQNSRHSDGTISGQYGININEGW